MLNQTTILIRTAQGEEEIVVESMTSCPTNGLHSILLMASLLKKAAPSLRTSLPGLLESLIIRGFTRNISQPDKSKGNLKIAIPLGKSTSSKKPKNLNSSGPINKNKFATGLSDPPSARARERGADLGTWTARTTSTRARERGEDLGALQDALAGFEADAQPKKKAPINAKVTEQTRIWEKAEEEEEARLWAEAAAKAKAEAEAKARAKAEAEAKAKAEAEAKAKEEAEAKEEEAKAKVEAEAKAENEAKDKDEVADATQQGSKSRHKKGKKARLRAEAQAKTSENTGKVQREIDDEAKIIAASEAYAKAVAMAEDEAKAKAGEINQKIEKEATEETEASSILTTLDFSTSESLDSEEALSNEIETKDIVSEKTSAEITSEAEVEIQDEEETRNETVTKKETWWFRKKKTDEVQETWREKEDVAVSEVQITTTPSFRRRQKPINISLIVPLLLVIILSGALLLPYVLPTTQYISTIEKIAANSVGEPIKIGSLRVSLLPIPNLDASNITIGNTITIKSAILSFSMFSSFSSDNLSKIELIGVNILPDTYDRIIKWTRSNNAPQLSNFKQIKLKNAKLEFENFAIPLLNGDIDLVNGSKFSRASFTTSDDKIRINITPKRKDFLLNISTKEWKPSHSSSIIFSSFDAKVIASRDSFHINEMYGKIYDGVFKGTASAKWSDGWNIKGQLEMERVNLEKATKSFNSDIPVGGNLTSNIEIDSKAPVFEKLYDTLHINGVFRLQNGFIKVDLGNSIRSKSKGDIAGGQTKFNDLSGAIEGTGKTYQLRQLKLFSGILSAEGDLDIGPSKELSGKVISNLKGTHTMTSGPVSLEGTINAPVLIRHQIL